jgi:hypothetical protein
MLDQSYDPGSTLVGGVVHSNASWSQSFTAGMAGTLDRVEVRVFRNGTPSDDLTLEIRTLLSGWPTSTVLTSASVGPGSIPDGAAAAAFVNFDFTDIAINIGDEYAIVLTSGTPDTALYGWEGKRADEYPGGRATKSSFGNPWQAANVLDLGFKTYVDPSGGVVPLPAACWLGLGLLAALGAGRRVPRRRSA